MQPARVKQFSTNGLIENVCNETDFDGLKNDQYLFELNPGKKSELLNILSCGQI